MTTAGHTVLIDDHSNATEVLGQHEGFITGCLGIEEKGTPIGDNTGACVRRGTGTPPDTLVSATQDRDVPALCRQIPGQFLDNGRLTSASDRKVSDAHNRTSDPMRVKDISAEQVDPSSDNPSVEER